MNVETLLAVVKLFKDFLENNATGWEEDDLFDLETDIVSKVLMYEFSATEISYKTASFDEEEALLEVEWDVAKITQKIDKKWTDKVIKKNSRRVIAIATESIQKNFNITAD